MQLEDSLCVRKAKIGDISSIKSLYKNMSAENKKFFHPFSFNTIKLTFVLTTIVISGMILPIVLRVYPKLGSTLVVAEHNGNILGFILFLITGKEKGKFVANVGLMTSQDTKRRGIGSKMYNFLIQKAKEANIGKFKVTVMEENMPSTMQVKKLGYVNKGYAEDEVWDGKRIKNIKWELELS